MGQCKRCGKPLRINGVAGNLCWDCWRPNDGTPYTEEQRQRWEDAIMEEAMRDWNDWPKDRKR